MKLKKGVIIMHHGDEYIAVAADEAGRHFNGMIKMNSTAAFIAQRLQEETTALSIADALQEKYDVSAEHALHSVQSLVSRLDSAGLIVNTDE